MTKLGIDAINPVHNGVKNLLIGWGPENFSLAYEKYFNPKQFEYEIGLFDRSHNKFLDVLVMNGLLGLISYLSIWFFFFKFIYKRKEFSLTNIGLLFLGVSLFTYLIFAFDQITTYIPFFVALAFIIFINIDSDSNNEIQNYKPNFYSTHIFFSILIFILSFSFLRNDLPSHLQMRHYLSFSGEINPQVMLDTVDPAFKPFTSAQGAIRNDFLLLISGNYISQNEYMVKLMDKAFLKAEEYVEKRPYDINFMITLASVYTNQGGNLGNIDLLKKGEEYSRKILVYSPNKQTCNYDLALNLLYQKRYAESFDYFEKSFNPTPSFFSLEAEKNLNIYFFFTKYFYSIKDKDNFIKAVNRLKENNFKEADDLSRIVDYINKYNYWPHVSFTK
jgi:hypothetical protein